MLLLLLLREWALLELFWCRCIVCFDSLLCRWWCKCCDGCVCVRVWPAAGSMNFEAFHASSFELGYVWVPEPTEERLANFLQSVFDWIALPVTKEAQEAQSAVGFGAGGALAAVPVYVERKYDGTTLDKWGKDVLREDEQEEGLLAVLDADLGGVRKVLPNFRVRPLDNIGR